MNFKNKKILVCGLGRSGIASAILLKKLGAFVSVSDIRDKSQLDLSKLSDVKVYAGQNPDDIILNYDLIILSPGIPTDSPFIISAKQNNIPFWSEIELAYRICPCPIIAITGTNGKTTTTSLTGEIIKNYRKNSVVAGNIGIALTEKMLMPPDENSFVTAEISSFQLETIDLFRPKISAILNITPDHLDRHKTFENYCVAKAKIFQNQNENDFTVLNYDDEICRAMILKTKAQTIFFSTETKLDNGVFLDGSKIKINIGNINENLMNIGEINLLGRHNVSNILAAIAICVCVDVPLNIIYNTIVNFKTVAHRLEFVREISGVKFYNDSKATNVDSAIKALEAVKNTVILIGGGYNKNVDFYEWIKYFKNVRYLILIGEVKNKIALQCDKLGFKNYLLLEKFEDAVKKSFEIAEPGDCILLSPACASWDMFENFEMRGDLFKQIVNSLV